MEVNNSKLSLCVSVCVCARACICERACVCGEGGRGCAGTWMIAILSLTSAVANTVETNDC